MPRAFRNLTESGVLLAVALLVIGFTHPNCNSSGSNTTGTTGGTNCAASTDGTYEMVWDATSTTGDFNCTGIISVTAEVSGGMISYQGLSYAVSGGGSTLTWTEDSTQQQVHTVASYSITVSNCAITGNGTFTKEFLNGGTSCSGVQSITGTKTS